MLFGSLFPLLYRRTVVLCTIQDHRAFAAASLLPQLMEQVVGRVTYVDLICTILGDNYNLVTLI